MPIGRSVSPASSRARPSAPSSRNRLCSAMPSSMCWPAGDSLHCIACAVSANGFARASGK
ncbi:MAG: hypothetical protein DMD92_21700 [Candidatus Rokuibacteriota bacterium]|nr:MAG: hypothetical protein DMD92_21700 [Candidatus Rokubacteria bacterium]